MGLEFQARSFVQLHPHDRADSLGGNVIWCTTGRARNFWHNCQDAKWSSYDAARQVYEHFEAFQHSRGFFGLTADFCDSPEHDRAYWLADRQFREVAAEGIFENKQTPAGLYRYYQWCHYACYLIGDDPLDWDEPPATSPEFPELAAKLDDQVDLAGWFFVEEEQEGFAELPGLFPAHSAGLSYTSCSTSHYLFVGEERIPLGEVLRPLLEASRRFPQGRGWLTLLDRPALPQFGIAAGNVYTLAPLDPSTFPYHPDIQFRTDRFGYEPRKPFGEPPKKA